MASRPEPVRKTWQQTKSEMTRTVILDAAIDCFYERGYASTTTENVADKAGVSRGAMLHHFPTRFDLITATVRHLSQKRLQMFEAEEARVQEGALYTRVEEGIDAYWAQLNTPVSIVFFELRMAARTDRELEEILVPVLDEYLEKSMALNRRTFPDLAQSEAFERACHMTRYLLEGAVQARLGKTTAPPVDELLSWLKHELRRSFEDVLGKVKRVQRRR